MPTKLYKQIFYGLAIVLHIEIFTSSP